jgi:hypothetical protein
MISEFVYWLEEYKRYHPMGGELIELAISVAVSALTAYLFIRYYMRMLTFTVLDILSPPI